jgi:hypothetical protein
MAAAVGLVLSCLAVLASVAGVCGRPSNDTLITQKLFWELEELARIVDISYCVGTAGLGIQKPFQCASRCADRDFETFELVTVSRTRRVHVVSHTVLILAGMEYRSLLI